MHAMRAASLREFPGYGLERKPPEHSSVSKTRKRLSLEAHEAVSSRVLEMVQASGIALEELAKLDRKRST